jgi:hypothetical protein
MVNFTTLWDNHPGSSIKPCLFENQCAIRMGVAFEKSKIDLSTFKGVKCWHNHKPKHILRAQELADWISKNEELFGIKKKYKRKEIPNLSFKDFEGKKGIIFIKDGWGPTDHIDIWDGNYLKGGSTDYLSKGIEIWFWSL